MNRHRWKIKAAQMPQVQEVFTVLRYPVTREYPGAENETRKQTDKAEPIRKAPRR